MKLSPSSRFQQQQQRRWTNRRLVIYVSFLLGALLLYNVWSSSNLRGGRGGLLLLGDNVNNLKSRGGGTSKFRGSGYASDELETSILYDCRTGKQKKRKL